MDVATVQTVIKKHKGPLGKNKAILILCEQTARNKSRTITKIECLLIFMYGSMQQRKFHFPNKYDKALSNFTAIKENLTVKK